MSNDNEKLEIEKKQQTVISDNTAGSRVKLSPIVIFPRYFWCLLTTLYEVGGMLPSMNNSGSRGMLQTAI